MNLTPQQKLEILCAYLPHGVECLIDGKTTARMHSVYFDGSCTFHDIVESEQGFESVRPILRHPDDMTDEEKRTFTSLAGKERTFMQSLCEDINYLHSIHIDTFEAIEAGWAIRKELN